MWIPRWLGEAYSKLYLAYGSGIFTFQGASEVLSLNGGMLKAALSGLHRKGVLAIFSKGRPRQYRLVTPDIFILIASGKVNAIEADIQLLPPTPWGSEVDFSCSLWVCRQGNGIREQ